MTKSDQTIVIIGLAILLIISFVFLWNFQSRPAILVHVDNEKISISSITFYGGQMGCIGCEGKYYVDAKIVDLESNVEAVCSANSPMGDFSVLDIKIPCDLGNKGEKQVTVKLYLRVNETKQFISSDEKVMQWNG